MPSNIYEFVMFFVALFLAAGIWDYLMANRHRVAAALRGEPIPPSGRTYVGRYQSRRRRVKQIRAQMGWR